MSNPFDDDEREESLDRLDDSDYLRDLAKRLYNIPVMHDTDGYDIGRLRDIAKTLEKIG